MSYENILSYKMAIEVLFVRVDHVMCAMYVREVFQRKPVWDDPREGTQEGREGRGMLHTTLNWAADGGDATQVTGTLDGLRSENLCRYRTSTFIPRRLDIIFFLSEKND